MVSWRSESSRHFFAMRSALPWSSRGMETSGDPGDPGEPRHTTGPEKHRKTMGKTHRNDRKWMKTVEKHIENGWKSWTSSGRVNLWPSVTYVLCHTSSRNNQKELAVWGLLSVMKIALKFHQLNNKNKLRYHFVYELPHVHVSPWLTTGILSICSSTYSALCIYMHVSVSPFIFKKYGKKSNKVIHSSHPKLIQT